MFNDLTTIIQNVNRQTINTVIIMLLMVWKPSWDIIFTDRLDKLAVEKTKITNYIFSHNTGCSALYKESNATPEQTTCPVKNHAIVNTETNIAIKNKRVT